MALPDNAQNPDSQGYWWDHLHSLPRSKELLRTPEQDLLWHYTTADGLVGIVRSGLIHATDLRFVNDSSEFTYGRDVALEELKKLRGKHKTVEHLETLVQDAGTRIRGIFCLCENGDLLPQWNGYAPGGGFAIGFDWAKLFAMVSPINCLLDRMQYNTENQHGLFAELFGEWIRLYESGEMTYSGGIFSGIQILRLALAMKHPAFEQEREWRLQFAPPCINDQDNLPIDGSSCDIRVAAGARLRPYYSISIRDEQARLPIGAVRLGPGNMQDLAVQYLFSVYNSGIVPTIEHSIIPLR